MRYLPTGKFMQQADFNTINNIGIPSMVLMERAALKTVEVMENDNTDLSNTVVFCGSGNNGGDGFAIARILDEKGYNVTVVFVGKESSLSTDCRTQRDIVIKKGIKVVDSVDEDNYTTVIDSVFGVGLNREIQGHYLDVIKKMNEMHGRKVAVDIPSGICSMSGTILGDAFKADLTATFQCEKIGMTLFPGYTYTGKTVVCPIGIDTSIYDTYKDISFTYDRDDIKRLMPKRKPDSHKGSYGKVLMITGSKGMAGASYLSAYAAYKCGAGLVRIYTPEDNRAVLQTLIPEAVMTTYTDFDKESIIEALNWADTVCIGCGLGTSNLSDKILETVIENVKVPLVIDADGINMLKDKLDKVNRLDIPVIITPHIMEMSRLSDVSVREIKNNRFNIIRDFTDKNNIICVLKDARTVVTLKGMQYYINTSGNSSMAKGGSGDVLSGVISALIAQGGDPFKTTCLGVYLHGCEGDEAAKHHGRYSVIARELADSLETCILDIKEYR